MSASSSDRPTERTSLGIAVLLAALTVVPFADGFVKMVAPRYPAAELVWLRYGMQTLLLLPICLWWYGWDAFRAKRPLTQALRSLFITGGAVCFFSAVAYIPLADAIAVFYVQPFIVTALAPLVLGERVGVWRWSAVGVGFFGALIIIRPGFQEVSMGTVFALGAGVCFALFTLMTRRLAGGDPPLKTNFLTGLGVSLILTPAIPFIWTAPSAADWPIIFTFASLGAVFSMLFVLAYAYAPAATLAPFTYLELLTAVLAGWFLFAHLPDAMTWIGMGVIASSGLVIVWRERLHRRRPGVAVQP